MSKVYQLSLYKYLGDIEDPKNFKVSSKEAYYKNSLGEIIYVYYSPYVGILCKNLTNLVTERFDNLEGVAYIDAIEDSSGEMVLLYKDKTTTFIKLYSQEVSKYVTYTLNISCDKAFLVNYDSEVFCIYINLTDNFIYSLKSSDGFRTPFKLHDRSFYKQSIVSVGYNPILNKPSVYLTVKDNTLLTNYEKHSILKDKVFVEVLVHPKLFKKVL